MRSENGGAPVVIGVLRGIPARGSASDDGHLGNVPAGCGNRSSDRGSVVSGEEDSPRRCRSPERTTIRAGGDGVRMSRWAGEGGRGGRGGVRTTTTKARPT